MSVLKSHLTGLVLQSDELAFQVHLFYGHLPAGPGVLAVTGGPRLGSLQFTLLGGRGDLSRGLPCPGRPLLPAGAGRESESV